MAITTTGYRFYSLSVHTILLLVGSQYRLTRPLETTILK